MRTRSWTAARRLVPLGLVLFLAAPAWNAAQDVDPVLRKASVDGRYAKLLKKIEVPGDAQQYGQFYDYGYYGHSTYGNFQNLPLGFWVYVAPHWYIWGEEVRVPPGVLRQASVNGKYAKLLKKIEVPADRKEYGEFNDYGYWNNTEYAGYQNLPKGYWVYVAPSWFIWGEQVGK
jgi:hypothetical protein